MPSMENCFHSTIESPSASSLEFLTSKWHSLTAGFGSADPFNSYEPVDSSAAAIAAQGLLRLGKQLKNDRYWQAGLTVCHSLLDEPYLSVKPDHQGLLLHSVYHRPKGWDFSPENNGVTHGESSMWGDYHIREVSLYLLRIVNGHPYLRFWCDSSG